MTHPAVEAVARAICCGGNDKCFMDDNHPHTKGLPCGWEGQIRSATAAIRALLDVPVSSEMLSQAYEANDYQNDDADNLAIWTAMLTQLVREIEGEEK